MNTSPSSLEDALAGVTVSALRTKLIEQYEGLKAAFSTSDYDACGLRAGKFCEVVLRVLQQALTQSHSPFGGTKVSFVDECRKLGQLPKTAGSDSLRMLIPQVITFVYALRNKRDIGHVGNDIDANEVDAATIVRCADWCVAELIRVTYTTPAPISLEEAQEILDAIVVRQIPTVWNVGGKKRVLNAGMTRKNQVLVLLYSEVQEAVVVEDLAAWVEAPRLDKFKDEVLRPLHEQRLVEFDRETQTAVISPTGIAAAEVILARGGMS
jgi:hypothetical protein